MRRIFTLLLIFLSALPVSAQISTEGTDFWVGLLYNVNMASGTSHVSISAKQACSGTLTNPSSGYSVSFSVADNSVTTLTIPNSEIQSKTNEVIGHLALHLQATDTVSVFTLNKAPFSSDASFAIPTPALGSTHRVISFTPVAGPSEALIIGVEDNTEVQITPTWNTTVGMTGGTTYTITLDAGETYMFSSTTDLTGSLIQTTDPCGKIAVLTGTACSNVPISCSACDHLYEQILPLETWGQSFFCAPLRNQLSDVFRVVASENNTKVIVGTTIKTLNAGQFFDTTIYQKPLAITASQPVGVMGYVIGSTCNNSWGDPDMYWVPPVEQNLYNLVFTTTALAGIDSQYVNIVVKTDDTASVKLNGSNIGGTFKVDPGAPQYAYSQYWLTTTVNNLASDKGFIAIVSGSGRSWDSYAYCAGTSVARLKATQYLINGIVKQASDTLELCRGDSYKFGLVRPGKAAWAVGDADTIQQSFFNYKFTDTGYHIVHAYPLSCFSEIEDTLTLWVHVNDICLSLEPLGDTTICRGQSVKLQALGTTPERNGCYRHEWFLNNIRISRGAPTVNPILTSVYKLISTDTCLGHKDTNFITVTVRPPVTARLNNDTIICKGHSVRLSALGQGGDSTYTFSWIKGLSGTGFSDTTVTPDVTTTYAVIVNDECTLLTDTAYITVYVRPELSLQTRDTTICTQGTALLRLQGLGGDSSYIYQWKHNGAFADTLVLTTNIATTLEVWLSDACTVKPDTGFVTVHVRPDPQIGVSPDTTICIGGVASLQAWGSYGDSSYVITWKNMGTGNSALAYPTATSIYEVMVEDQCSAEKDTAWIKVNVRPALDAYIRPDTTICTGQSVDLWVKGRGGDSTYTYAWEALGNASIQNVNPTATTTYRLVLGDNCTTKNDTAYTTIFVRPPLGVTANNDTVICRGQSVILNAIGSGGDSSYTYSWNQGLGAGASHIVTPNVTTTYTVTLGDDCSPAIQEPITVTIEGDPVIDFNAAPTQICLGDSVIFTNNTAGTYSYLWRFGDKTVSTGNDPTHIYGKPGQYNITLVAISPLFCRDSMTINDLVQVYANPKAAYTANPPATNLLTPLISFKNNSQLANTYQWDFGDMSGSSDKHPKHSYLDTGWYDISLIVTGANSCTDTALGRLRINDYFKIFIPNAFSPNGDNTNELFEVKGRGIIEYHITIHNRWGEVIFESDSITRSWDGKMPGQVSPSPDGVYYYMIELLDVSRQKKQYNGEITLLK